MVTRTAIMDQMNQQHALTEIAVVDILNVKTFNVFLPYGYAMEK